MKDHDKIIIAALIVGAFVLYFASKSASSSAPSQSAGAGIDPYDESEYTVDAIALLGGI